MHNKNKEVEMMELSELKLPQRNVRKHPEQQIKEYIRSLEMFGQTKPFVIDENNEVLIGNGMYKAMERMGERITKVMVIKRTDLSSSEKKKLVIADNKIFSLGVDDLDTTNDFIREMLDYDIPGFDEDLLHMMMADAEEVTERIAEYGTLEADEIQMIQQRGQNQQPEPNLRVPNTEVNTNTSDSLNDATGHFQGTGETSEPQTSVEQRRCIVCPKCGEQIWL